MNANSKIEVFNMSLPSEGPRVVPYNVDFTTEIQAELDLTQLINDGWVSFISGAWIDNLDNTQDVTLICDATYQRVIIPAGTQGWYSLLSANPPRYRISQSAASTYVRILFVNFPVWPFVMGANGGSGGEVTISGPEIITDSLELEGIVQEIFAANVANAYFMLQNPLGNDPVSVNIGGGDASVTGFTILPGGTLELPNGTTSSVTIFGTDGNTVIFARSVTA